jgi:hypothetical protein
MKPEKRFYIMGTVDPKPNSHHTIYVDGTAEDGFREGLDIELSHWIPNRTPEKYKAGTSTEICFNFLEDKEASSYDLVINNHLDIDGLLSVFVLAYPTIALQHRDVLCEASKTGDFWAWSTGKGLKLFQELTLFYKDLQSQKVYIQEAYEKCFDLILHILSSPDDMNEAQMILDGQALLIEQGKIRRHEIASRLVAYHVPRDIAYGNEEAFFAIPRFNEPISGSLAFWPQVRNRLDGEKLQLLGVETPQGIHYDLWYPGYAWADTKGWWNPPGLSLPEKAGDFQALHWPELSKVIQSLNQLETKECRWQLFPGLHFSSQDNPRGFPVVATTLGASPHHGSVLPWERVLEVFQGLGEDE